MNVHKPTFFEVIGDIRDIVIDKYRYGIGLV